MLVHSFESMAARDGDGIRFCVFLAGCPLKCVYCHNPDTQVRTGREMTHEELLKKIVRYKPYFANGGGVTFSGGEPLLWAEDIVILGQMLKDNGISYALDTSLCISLNDSVKRAIDSSELIIADLKFPSDELMYKYTHGSLALVLKCLEYIKASGKRFIVRSVIVPGINDSLDSLSEYLPLIESFEPEYWELLPFHTMGFFKYDDLGLENMLRDTPAMDMTRLDELKKQLKTKVKIK